MESEIFTVERAAALANCSSRTIERALASGALTATRVGMVRQISHPELDRFIKSRMESPAEVETPETVELKQWSIAVGSMARAPSCGKCGGFDGVGRSHSWQIFCNGRVCCELCRKLAPAELISIHSKLTEQGAPGDGERFFGIYSNQIAVSNTMCPISKGAAAASREYPWLICCYGGENQVLSMEGAERATPDLARVIHSHRGTVPAAPVEPPAPAIPDPSIAERARTRASQVKTLKAIVWQVNAQDHPEIKRKAEMLLDFLLELISKN